VYNIEKAKGGDMDEKGRFHCQDSYFSNCRRQFIAARPIAESNFSINRRGKKAF